MASIEDMSGDDDSSDDGFNPDFDPSDGVNQDNNPVSKVKEVLQAKPADKKLSDYDDHALNLTGGEGNKEFIKGLEGIVADMDRAVVYMIKGLWKELQAKGGSS